MRLNIAQKRRQLEELTAQLSSVQQEVLDLERDFPEFVTRMQKLEQNKQELVRKLESPILLHIENFADISCIWSGVKKWPQIIDWKFLFNEEINAFLEALLFDEGRISLLFEMEIKEIKKTLISLNELDDLIILHNKEVVDLFNESGDADVLLFRISEII